MPNERNITNPYGKNLVYADGITRQRSKCKAIVYSHITDNECAGVIDLTDDVVECETSKTIKGGGGASLALVPRRNYLNYVFPDDWILIWFDPGDGRGMMRNFMGFVDRISREVETDSSTGATTTRYRVICSDFTKAFDKTNIYFNPHIADRDDFASNFAGSRNLAGAQLRMMGITAFGTPADIVMNLAVIMLGFNAQFILPPEFPLDDYAIKVNREIRRKWVTNRLPEDVIKAVGSSTFTEWVDGNIEAANNLVRQWRESDEVTDLDGNPLPYTETHGFTSDNKDYYMNEVAFGMLAEKDGVSSKFIKSSDFNILYKMDISASDKATKCLLDLIDFSFLEYLAIDGSIVSTPIWTMQGTLWSIMNAFSNPMINELFCDLRPVSEGFDYDPDGPLREGGYSTDADYALYLGSEREIKENKFTPGVKFVPALIMREYPFSTIEDVDFSKAIILGEPVGSVKMGNIFSKQPVGKIGRSVVKLKRPLHDYMSQIDPAATAVKHIDVYAISIRDIINESIGRSDHDVVNLLEMYADVGHDMKFITQDIQPITNPISIFRHGLRVRSYSSRFARFSKEVQKYSGVDNVGTRRKLIRWATMLDHWYQHNIEYLNGTITTRAFPEIRVGYRLDILERKESYYVEGVNHRWAYPGAMTSAFTLSRGQRNDPFPVYVKPALRSTQGNRTDLGRLADFFKTINPEAVRHALKDEVIRGRRQEVDGEEPDYGQMKMENVADYVPSENAPKDWMRNGFGYVVANQGQWYITEILQEEYYKNKELEEKAMITQAEDLLRPYDKDVLARKISTGKPTLPTPKLEWHPSSGGIKRK